MLKRSPKGEAQATETGETMRAFAALDLDEGFRDDVARLARQLSVVAPGRYLPRENYHVTLAFLGDIGEAEARGAMDALDEAAAAAAPIDLVPQGLGTFGRPRDATLFLALAPDPALVDLAARLRAALSARGIGFDAKAFRPHVTLARRARLGATPLEGLAFPPPVRAPRAVLYRSILSFEGARYKELYARDLDLG